MSRSTFGKRGGDGPNTGLKAVTYVATTPEGTEVRRRVFKNIPVDTDGRPLKVCIAALLAPVNGYGWSLWVVASSKETMPSFVTTTHFAEARLVEKGQA